MSEKQAYRCSPPSRIAWDRTPGQISGSAEAKELEDHCWSIGEGVPSVALTISLKPSLHPARPFPPAQRSCLDLTGARLRAKRPPSELFKEPKDDLVVPKVSENGNLEIQKWSLSCFPFDTTLKYPGVPFLGGMTHPEIQFYPESNRSEGVKKWMTNTQG